MTPPRPPLLLWIALALPAAGLVYGYASGAMSYGEFIHYSGDISVEILIITLAATPLRLLAPGGFSLWLMRRRRDFGVGSFCYAALHLAVYLLRKADAALIVEEGIEPDLLTGWVALAMMAALAITSNDVSMRALKRAWKKLHLLVYPAAVLALMHWVLTAFDPLTAYIHAGVLAAIEGLRLILRARRRVSSASRSS